MVNLTTRFHKLLRFFFHSLINSNLNPNPPLSSIIPHVLTDLHRAELRPTHRTEVRHLMRILRHGLVMVFTRTLRIECQAELVFPAEFETRLAHRVVTDLRTGMALGEIGRMCSDLVGDDAGTDILFIRQSQMFFRCDVTQHGTAVPADLRGTDAGGDVVVTRCDIGGQRTEGVERCFEAVFQLLVHVLLDHLHRNMAGAFDHHLHIMLPGDLGQLT